MDLEDRCLYRVDHGGDGDSSGISDANLLPSIAGTVVTLRSRWWSHPVSNACRASLVLILFVVAAEARLVGGKQRLQQSAATFGARTGHTIQLSDAAGAQTMPKMIYGTAWKEERTTELVKQALVAGFTGVDTANQPAHYREDLVGMGMQQFLKEQPAKSRSDIFIQTKYSPGQDGSQYGADIKPYDSSVPVPQQVRQSLDSSLEHLQTDYIDSLVLHSPLQTVELTMQAWRSMEQLVTEGKVKQIGISNIYDLPVLQEVYAQATIKPSVVQNHFATDTCFDIELRRWCRDHGIQYQSFWTLTANHPGLVSKPVQDIVQARGLTKEQVWFLFVMGDGIIPLTGTKDQEHMQQDLSLLTKTPLSSEERESIWGFIQQQTRCPALPIA